MLIPLLLAATVAIPPGCVCDPPSVKGCIQVEQQDRTPCGEKLRTCLDWCVAHPPKPKTPAKK
jgi:hypothetical protein